MTASPNVSIMDDLPIEQKLAISHATGFHKHALTAFLSLDRRMGQFVSQSKEGMLTQMRIAWWRDQLGKAVEGRPNGDATLDAISRQWVGEESALVALVDGWEALLSEPPLPDDAALEFASGRAACFAAMVRLNGTDRERDMKNASHCGAVWALADLASRMSDTDERSIVLDLAEDQCDGPIKLPYALRSLMVLGSLGRRSIARSGGPLIAGRADIFHIMKIGMFGR
ncbi:MAG: hypothetical protein WA908_10270 [Pontixanthobacter sp.]